MDFWRGKKIKSIRPSQIGLKFSIKEFTQIGPEIDFLFSGPI